MLHFLYFLFLLQHVQISSEVCSLNGLTAAAHIAAHTIEDLFSEPQAMTELLAAFLIQNEALGAPVPQRSFDDLYTRPATDLPSSLGPVIIDHYPTRVTEFLVSPWGRDYIFNETCAYEKWKNGTAFPSLNKAYTTGCVQQKSGNLSDICPTDFPKCPLFSNVWNTPIDFGTWNQTINGTCPIYCLNPKRYNNSIANYIWQFTDVLNIMGPAYLQRVSNVATDVYFTNDRGMWRFVPTVAGADFTAFVGDDAQQSLTALAGPQYNPTGVTVWSPTLLSGSAAIPLITVVTPINVGTEFRGVVASDVSMVTTVSTIESFTATNNSFPLLMDNQYGIVAASQLTYDIFFCTDNCPGVYTSNEQAPSTYCLSSNARIDSTQAWCVPDDSEDTGTALEDNLQIDLLSPRHIIAVTTQGGPIQINSAGWVTSYKIRYSNNGKNWTEIATEFDGNVDLLNSNTNTINITARYVRIYPTAYVNSKMLRACLTVAQGEHCNDGSFNLTDYAAVSRDILKVQDSNFFDPFFLNSTIRDNTTGEWIAHGLQQVSTTRGSYYVVWEALTSESLPWMYLDIIPIDDLSNIAEWSTTTPFLTFFRGIATSVNVTITNDGTYDADFVISLAPYENDFNFSIDQGTLKSGQSMNVTITYTFDNSSDSTQTFSYLLTIAGDPNSEHGTCFRSLVIPVSTFSAHPLGPPPNGSNGAVLAQVLGIIAFIPYTVIFLASIILLALKGNQKPLSVYSPSLLAITTSSMIFFGSNELNIMMGLTTYPCSLLYWPNILAPHFLFAPVVVLLIKLHHFWKLVSYKNTIGTQKLDMVMLRRINSLRDSLTEKRVALYVLAIIVAQIVFSIILAFTVNDDAENYGLDAVGCQVGNRLLWSIFFYYLTYLIGIGFMLWFTQDVQEVMGIRREVTMLLIYGFVFFAIVILAEVVLGSPTESPANLLGLFCVIPWVWQVRVVVVPAMRTFQTFRSLNPEHASESLTDFLSSKKGFKYFLYYCGLEYSTENPLCWQAIEHFKRHTSPEALKDIFHKFLDTNAPFCVNISHNERENVRQWMKKADSAHWKELQTALDPALKAVTLLMESDSWHRFLDHDVYQCYLKNLPLPKGEKEGSSTTPGTTPGAVQRKMSKTHTVEDPNYSPPLGPSPDLRLGRDMSPLDTKEVLNPIQEKTYFFRNQDNSPVQANESGDHALDMSQNSPLNPDGLSSSSPPSQFESTLAQTPSHNNHTHEKRESNSTEMIQIGIVTPTGKLASIEEYRKETVGVTPQSV